jgi:glyoxylase-like metal-dependent hydrolase (beta-lactamase superfamily II)
VRYVQVDGELLPGLRLVPAPGHTRGLQVVVIETAGRPIVVGGDAAVRIGELDEPHTEGQPAGYAPYGHVTMFDCTHHTTTDASFVRA